MWETFLMVPHSEAFTYLIVELYGDILIAKANPVYFGDGGFDIQSKESRVPPETCGCIPRSKVAEIPIEDGCDEDAE